jgi:hypothetical protein
LAFVAGAVNERVAVAAGHTVGSVVEDDRRVREPGGISMECERIVVYGFAVRVLNGLENAI